MCIGYDPFRYADAFDSEEEYFMELEKEQEKKSKCLQMKKDGNISEEVILPQ